MEGKAEINSPYYYSGIYNSSSRKVRFRSGCPVSGCKNSNSDILWYCNLNHHPLYLHDDAILSCDDSRGLYGNIFNWKFNCGEHDYKYASYQSVLGTLSILGHFTDYDFIEKIMIKIRQYS